MQAAPPEWGTDSLSAKYFNDAERNTRAFVVNHPEVFDLLRRVHVCFENVSAAATHAQPGPSRLIPRFLLVRSHSAFLAACRLSMSGQTLEAQILNRATIENAWYALHIATDPCPDCRADIWLNRNDDDVAKRTCKQEFSIANVRRSHSAAQPDDEVEMAKLYEMTIDFGAHPNQLGVLNSIRSTEDAQKTDYLVGILAPDAVNMMSSLRVSCGAAVGAFKVFSHIYPERFVLMGIDADVAGVVGSLNSIFRRYTQTA